MKKIIRILVCMMIVISFVFVTEAALAENTVIWSVGINETPYLIDLTVYDLNSPPETPIINGTTHGTIGVTYDYTFVTVDPDGDDVYYQINWEPGCPSINWFGPYPSGQIITFSHTFSRKGTYPISCTAKDIYNATSDFGSLTVTMSRSKAINRSFFNFFQNFFENYPNLFKILQ